MKTLEERVTTLEEQMQELLHKLDNATPLDYDVITRYVAMCIAQAVSTTKSKEVANTDLLFAGVKKWPPNF